MLLWWGAIGGPRPARSTAPASRGEVVPLRRGKPAPKARTSSRAAAEPAHAALPAEVRRARTLLQFGDTIGAADACRALLTSTDRRIGPLERAAARLAFGEVFERSGDYMSACEQWLMARDLYEECGARQAAREVWSRMRALNAPTDWVLTSY